jgi:hypothetical protein
MLNVKFLSAIILSVNILSNIMSSVIMLSVIKLSVVLAIVPIVFPSTVAARRAISKALDIKSIYF